MQQEKVPTVIIVGAGPGGLTLYHSLIKNKDKKEFNVKIFERESGPKDRWQGYHIGFKSQGFKSLMNCIPSSVALNLPKAIPNPVPGVEYHGTSFSDHEGNLLLRPPFKQFKNIYEIAEIPDRFLSGTIAYRDRLRDVLLENVPVQWGKKLVRYEETDEGVWVNFDDGSREFCDILVDASGINSPIRKQKIPELQINDIGTTYAVASAVVPKHLMDRLIKVNGNSVIQKLLGLNGDSTFIGLRLIPIEQEQNFKNKNHSDELHYRITMFYFYSSELDNEEIEKINNNPALVVEHIKNMIRKLRPECEMTNILLELWDLVPKAVPKESEDFPFKTYNPIQLRKVRDINLLTINSWTSSRVTLIGDAAHAMSPYLGLGTTHAIQDAEALSQALLNYSPENYISCIKEYENKMLKRATVDVLKSRYATIKQVTPVGYFGLIIRNRGLLYIILDIVKFCYYCIRGNALYIQFGSSLVQRTPGLNGDSTFIALRLISIEQEQNYKNENKSECFIIELFYLSELDIGHMSGKFGFEMEAGIDVVEVDGGGVKVKVRPNLDTGASISSDGVEAKVGGVGFKVGKVTGFSTPLGNFEINFVKMFG
ncbi:FAD/NAD(P)-binding domain-containing protein [Rhizophagus irregularis]|uniref:FAD/NAD(P)-binding domain-containing protein n=4 Tax=Rhizophagus irregularis TaxID=588596 RepID=A0A2N0QZF8_9GLOM|nr:FAD/NAD(P)-binding domain-containing protein [Rhizophagus irregularis]